MMDKLQDLSQQELEEVLDNPQRVEAMALESDEVQNIQLEREMALASNRSLAEQNLELKPHLERGRERLVELYTELERVRGIYLQHCAQRDGIEGQACPEALISQLQRESSGTEAESEIVAEQFLDGSVSLDSFLERFLSLRLLAHTRRVRLEKLQEVVRQSLVCKDVVGSAPIVGPAPITGTSQPSTDSAPILPYTPYPVTPPVTVAPQGLASFRMSSCPYPMPSCFPTGPAPYSAHFPTVQPPYPTQYPSHTQYTYPPPPAPPRPLYQPGFGLPQPYS